MGHAIELWYNKFRVSPAREALLRDVLADAAASGQQVILVQLPFRDAYLRELQRSHATDYQAFLDATAALPHVDRILFEGAAPCGLTDADFLDWTHLNEAGAATFARAFAASLPEDVRTVIRDCGAALTLE
ncbi:MAG: hypothetical protein K8T26_03395 [Lentisphaerae bacterium]|nr:hypothetical protein [Lentisphaerota bacterium]